MLQKEHQGHIACYEKEKTPCDEGHWMRRPSGTYLICIPSSPESPLSLSISSPFSFFPLALSHMTSSSSNPTRAPFQNSGQQAKQDETKRCQAQGWVRGWCQTGRDWAQLYPEALTPTLGPNRNGTSRTEQSTHLSQVSMCARRAENDAQQVRDRGG